MTPVPPTSPGDLGYPNHDVSGAILLRLSSRPSQAKDLPEQTRRHWVCSLRQVAKWLDRPAAVVPARWQSVRISVGQMHHARVGVTPRPWPTTSPTSGRRCGGSAMSTTYRGGVPLWPEWARFSDGLDKRMRDRLSG